jgi:hypothetical protein
MKQTSSNKISLKQIALTFELSDPSRKNATINIEEMHRFSSMIDTNPNAHDRARSPRADQAKMETPM